jgi:integrase
MNKKIKEVGKLAGINDEIITIITRGGKRVETAIKKFEKITNHTARRSFATNLYLAGVPTLAIMKMTGHKTERSFLKYIRVTPEENAFRIAQHPYFLKK